MGHLNQYRQGVRSKKPKLENSHPEPPPVTLPSESSKELYFHVMLISKLYTNETG